MDEFPGRQPDTGGCLVKIIVFLLLMGMTCILLLGIVTGIFLAGGLSPM